MDIQKLTNLLKESSRTGNYADFNKEVLHCAPAMIQWINDAAGFTAIIRAGLEQGDLQTKKHDVTMGMLLMIQGLWGRLSPVETAKQAASSLPGKELSNPPKSPLKTNNHLTLIK